MESILTSIKKLLGITSEYTHFDADIIEHINSVFSDLAQLGVGPDKGFSITDEEDLWTDFIPHNDLLQSVKSYMYLRVRLLFDTSTISASVLSSMERQIEKMEWRLSIAADKPTEDIANKTVDGIVFVDRIDGTEYELYVADNQLRMSELGGGSE